jgi:uncharacterized membrane-anchored protein YjiN (DUF445 family)
LATFEDEDVARFLSRTVLTELEKVNLARVAGEVLEVVTAGDEYQALLDDALRGVERLISQNEALILEKFGEASKYTPAFVDSYIVRKFVGGVIQLLREVAGHPEHPMRLQFAQATQTLIDDLKTSPHLYERGVAIKARILEHLRDTPYYRTVWNNLKARVLADLDAEPSRIRVTLASTFATFGAGLARDEALQRKLNDGLLSALQSLMVAHRHQISRLITDVVKSWDTRDVTAKIELEIGKDLQFIRLNGTVVGGCVGVALHAITTLLG